MRRRLTPAEKEAVRRALTDRGVAPEALLDRALEEAELIDRAPVLKEVRGLRSLVAHCALTWQAIGIALGPQVYLRRSQVEAGGSVPLGLLAHELTHVVQFRRDGTLPFLARYLSAYVRGRLHGRSHHDAYLSIFYEQEARGVEAIATAWVPPATPPRASPRPPPARK